MPDGGCCCGENGWRQRCRKDEAGRIGAHGVDQMGVCWDIAAEEAERLGESTFDDIDTSHGAVPLGNPAATRPIHADGVNFVNIGQCTVTLGKVANAMATSPSMEYRLSHRISLGRSGPAARSNCSRCWVSLWRHICFSEPVCVPKT